MNKTLKIFTIGTIMGVYSVTANAGTTYIVCPTDTGTVPANCASYTSICPYGAVNPVANTCDTCNGGYDRVPTDKVYGSFTVYECKQQLPCTACITSWEPCSNSTDCISPGMERRIYGGTCINNTWESHGKCTEPDYQYRCAAGYGHDATSRWDEVYACAKCPDDDNGNAGTSAAGTVFYDDAFYEGCYIAEGATFMDKFGSGKYADDCPYEVDSSSSSV